LGQTWANFAVMLRAKLRILMAFIETKIFVLSN